MTRPYLVRCETCTEQTGQVDWFAFETSPERWAWIQDHFRATRHFHHTTYDDLRAIGDVAAADTGQWPPTGSSQLPPTWLPTPPPPTVQVLQVATRVDGVMVGWTAEILLPSRRPGWRRRKPPSPALWPPPARLARHAAGPSPKRAWRCHA